MKQLSTGTPSYMHATIIVYAVHTCNVGLGVFQDDLVVLEEAQQLLISKGIHKGLAGVLATEQVAKGTTPHTPGDSRTQQ